MSKILIHNDELGTERSITPGAARSLLATGWLPGGLGATAPASEAVAELPTPEETAVGVDIVAAPADDEPEVIELAPGFAAPVVHDHGPTTAALKAAAKPPRGTNTPTPVTEEGTAP